MAEIIPAVMPKTLDDLREHVSRIVGATKTVQVDVMDGIFVRERTWPYIRPDDYFENIVQGEEGLPSWEDIDYEIDLMVADPFTAADKWVSAGVKRILFHVESFSDFPKDIEKILSYKNDFTEVGLAIAVETQVETIAPYLAELSCVQCMGIQRVGYQGEQFVRLVLEKIKAIKALAPELPVSVDGGVNFDNAASIIEAGADRLVSGSVVFNSINTMDAIRRLRSW